MKWIYWLQALGITVCMGCGTPSAETPNSVDTDRPSNEIVDATDRESAQVKDLSEILNVRADGVMGDDGDCLRLIAQEPIFDNEAAMKAWQLYSAKKYAEARASFQAVLSSEAGLSKSDRQKVQFISALAAQKADKDEEGLSQATDLMKRAFEIDAPLKHASAVYGTRLGYRAHRWQNVVDFTTDLLNSQEFRTYRAIALTNLGQYEAAATEFERIETFPKNLRLDGLEARARAQSETSQLKSSLETYRRIYELDPNSPQGQMAQEAIMAQKDKWPADFTFPRSTQKTDKAKSAREIALGHFNAHRSEQAIAAYTKLLKDDKKRNDINNVCDDLYGIARSYVKLRSHTKSLPYFQEGLETCEKTDFGIKILYSGAKAAWNAGQNAQAIDWYQKIIDNYPNHSYADDAYYYQAQILTGQGKLDDARNVLNKQIEAYPDGDMAPDSYWMLLSDLYERGLYQEAVEFVDKNIDHAGESDLYSQGRLRYFQGRSYEKLGNHEHALQNYLTILDEYPLAYYAMLSLGRLEKIDSGQAKLWLETYRPEIYKPEQGQDYCFQVIHKTEEFSAARVLVQIGLYSDALDELDPLIDSEEPRVVYEARLGRAMLLQKNGRYSDSARLAASLLKPNQDLNNKGYAAWILAYPKPWSNLVESAAQPESTLYYTAYAIMREESYYNPKAESWANARGLMQLMLPTAQSTAETIGLSKPAAQDLFKPEIAIPIGAAYIDKLNHILVPHPMFVLPGYNAGQGNVGKWMTRFADIDVDLYVEKIPFKEARHYAKRVGTTLWRYRWLYDKDMPEIFDPAQKVGDLKQ